MSKKIILYPTDTLYGLGVDATDSEAVSRLIALKGRDEGKPISIVVDSLEMAQEYVVVTPLALRLAEKFLPGPLTLVFEAKCATPRCCTKHSTCLVSGVVGSDGSVGVRIPNHRVPLELVRRLQVPLTATSANVSGMPTERSVKGILEQFGDKASWIDEVIDGGEFPESPGSTVVDARGEEPIIIRTGALSEVAIREALG